LSYIIPTSHPTQDLKQTPPTTTNPGGEEKKYHGTSTNRRWSFEDGRQPSGGSSAASSAAVELSSPSYTASSETTMESPSDNGIHGVTKKYTKDGRPSVRKHCVPRRGVCNPSEGYIFGAREDSTFNTSTNGLRLLQHL
jgi:hypothetical protein